MTSMMKTGSTAERHSQKLLIAVLLSFDAAWKSEILRTGSRRPEQCTTALNTFEALFQPTVISFLALSGNYGV
jgi:hypothetical protein